MDYLTIKEISEKLGIPESTARHYRDKFSEFIEIKGQGRKRRYHTSSLDVLRYVAEASKRNESQDKIFEGLSMLFNRVYNVGQETQRNNVAATQDDKKDISELGKIESTSLEVLTQAILRLAIAQEERNEVLAQEVTSLRSQVAQLTSMLALPSSSVAPGKSSEEAGKKAWRKFR